MNENKANFSYDNFKKANQNSDSSTISYINFIYQAFTLPSDFIIAFQKFCSPDFMMIDGLLYNKDQFNQVKYDEMLGQNIPKNQIQYWLNLILVSDLFIGFPANEGVFENVEDLPLECAMQFSKNLADSWNAIIAQKFGEKYAVARYIFDEEYQEAYVTLGDYR